MKCPEGKSEEKKVINITTCIEVPKDFDIDKIYEEFRLWIADAHNSGDLSVFMFTDEEGNEVLE